ncbi:MAG: hypothetical protein HY235_26745 [Acidobacteria bacterium]|nr:hypothetical protein [Acidobacteriota bacterium]
MTSWLKLAGRLRRLRKETARINRFLDQEFEKVEPQELILDTNAQSEMGPKEL